MRWRSSGSLSSEFSGETFAGRLASLTSHSAGSSYAGVDMVGAQCRARTRSRQATPQPSPCLRRSALPPRRCAQGSARSASVAPPVERERPARQGLARIPFALAVMQEPAGREPVAQAPDQPVGERPLGRADRVRVPFARFKVVDRNEGRLAAHGQADVVGDELLVDLLAERVERLSRRPRKTAW